MRQKLKIGPINWHVNPRSCFRTLVIFALTLGIATVISWRWWQGRGTESISPSPLNQAFWQWAKGDEETRAGLVVSRKSTCPGAPLLLPTEGYIGLVYGDPRGPYTKRQPHQGIDIFSNSEAGVTPVYAAYDGYVTRQANWTSSLIIRVPDDPLRPGRQIWLYYTHMADREGNDFIEDQFPADTKEQFVRKGALLGHTGDYNGNSPRRIWVHLHFSVVEDDGKGNYLNELDIENTLDPSPYFGMTLSYGCLVTQSCAAYPSCE